MIAWHSQFVVGRYDDCRTDCAAQWFEEPVAPAVPQQQVCAVEVYSPRFGVFERQAMDFGVKVVGSPLCEDRVKDEYQPFLSGQFDYALYRVDILIGVGEQEVRVEAVFYCCVYASDNVVV